MLTKKETIIKCIIVAHKIILIHITKFVNIEGLFVVNSNEFINSNHM